jgi:hypothetical protein
MRLLKDWNAPLCQKTPVTASHIACMFISNATLLTSSDFFFKSSEQTILQVLKTGPYYKPHATSKQTFDTINKYPKEQALLQFVNK